MKKSNIQIGSVGLRTVKRFKHDIMLFEQDSHIEEVTATPV